jgi:hypothetical protein
MREKMNTKKILVSLCTIAIALFLVATVSANTSLVNGDVTTEVDGVNVDSHPAVIAGDNVAVSVEFTVGDLDLSTPALDGSASDIKVKVTLEGDKVDSQVVSIPFDVEAGQTYKKTLKLQVPSELKDQLSDNVALTVRIWNGDYELEVEKTLRVQRPSYNPVVKSITTSQTIQAGETIPVDVVLKNLGYNDLNDVYVTVGISALGVEQTSYFGDLVTKEDCTNNCDDTEKDTVSGRIFLEVPYTAKAGVYTLEVKVTNDDVTSTFARQVVVENDLSENVIVTSTGKTVAVGEDATYTLLLVNPTNSLKIYKVVADSSGEVSSSVDSTVVAVPAGSSKTVTVTASAKSEGEYNFDVSVLSGDKLVSKVTLNLKAEGKSVNPIVVLTVVLAIIFLVLLVVLIVLIGKKPQKSEEFGESYY